MTAATSARARPGPLLASRTCNSPSRVAGRASRRHASGRRVGGGHDEVLGEEGDALAPAGEGVDRLVVEVVPAAGEGADQLGGVARPGRSWMACVEQVLEGTGGLAPVRTVISTSEPGGRGRPSGGAALSTAVSSAQWRSSTTRTTGDTSASAATHSWRAPMIASRRRSGASSAVGLPSPASPMSVASARTEATGRPVRRARASSAARVWPGRGVEPSSRAFSIPRRTAPSPTWRKSCPQLISITSAPSWRATSMA